MDSSLEFVVPKEPIGRLFNGCLQDIQRICIFKCGGFFSKLLFHFGELLLVLWLSILILRPRRVIFQIKKFPYFYTLVIAYKLITSIAQSVVWRHGMLTVFVSLLVTCFFGCSLFTSEYRKDRDAVYIFLNSHAAQL